MVIWSNWASGDSVVKKNLPTNAGDTVLVPWLEDPPEEEMTTHSSSLAWAIHGQRSPAGYSS